MRSPFDRNQVQQALEKILADQQSASLSMREVARRLGYPVRTIKTHFPIQSREITRRYIEHRKQQGLLRKVHLRQRINEAARVVLIQGNNLTYQRVGTILGEPGCFREYEARRTLLDIRYQQVSEVALVDVDRSRGDINPASILVE
jgi:AcrR family transcriptional regulator